MFTWEWCPHPSTTGWTTRSSSRTFVALFHHFSPKIQRRYPIQHKPKSKKIKDRSMMTDTSTRATLPAIHTSLKDPGQHNDQWKKQKACYVICSPTTCNATSHRSLYQMSNNRVLLEPLVTIQPPTPRTLHYTLIGGKRTFAFPISPINLWPQQPTTSSSTSVPVHHPHSPSDKVANHPNKPKDSQSCSHNENHSVAKKGEEHLQQPSHSSPSSSRTQPRPSNITHFPKSQNNKPAAKSISTLIQQTHRLHHQLPSWFNNRVRKASSSSSSSGNRGGGKRLHDREFNHGRWTKEEHESFLRGYQNCGRDWSKIARDYVPSRMRSQVASHAQKYFARLEEEEGMMLSTANSSHCHHHHHQGNNHEYDFRSTDEYEDEDDDTASDNDDYSLHALVK